MEQIDSEASGAIGFYRNASRRRHLQPSRCSQINCRVVYLAVLHGHMPSDRIHCRASVCVPSRGFRDFRLAGERTEGQAAYSIFMPIATGSYKDMPVTLTEIRPLQGKREHPQAKYLVAAG